MGQEQPTPDYSDQPERNSAGSEQPELDRTQPSPTRPPRKLDWRPPDHQPSGGQSQQEPPPPPPRREQQHARRRRRPPTEGAPAWVVGLGVGALLAVILLLVVAFVLSRRSAQPEPTPTAVVVTLTPTLVPRPTATAADAVTPTGDAQATQQVIATAPPADTIAIGGYVRVVAPAGLSFRQNPNVGGALILVMDAGTVLEVVGGPTEADGYTWWQLRTLNDGREGWSAVGAGQDVFLEPAPAP